ncbi:MAG: M50 family peptidase [Chloroflexi bacterium CFX4]|nr:M50 family peptidase [Chloroflexi bacterium CFX4]MDL1922606.1 M50 family metallopeptidase [Chloroflexi bacterium CFX3]
MSSYERLYNNADKDAAAHGTEGRTRRRILFVSLGAFALVFLLWQIAPRNETVSSLLYPFRLLVTFVHEAGHGLSALLTGGRFIEFRVFPNGAGLATTAGGNRIIITQMGYLGAAFFGAILLFAANRVRRVHLVAVLTGLFFIGCALLFTGGEGALLIGGIGLTIGLWSAGGALRESENQMQVIFRGAAVGALVLTFVLVRDNVALLTGIVSGTALFALAAFGSRIVVTFLLNALALIVGFNALNDILSLWNSQSTMLGNVPNDALAVARLTNLPVNFWLLVWIAITLGVMGASIWFGIIRPTRQPH